MALKIVDPESDRRGWVSIDWPAVQWAQFEHDEKFHREISRLSVQDRLRHMALHFAKYAGRLHEDVADDRFKQTIIDTLIIAVSTANTLNYDLSEVVSSDEGGLSTRENFVRQLTISAGRMAAACERLDHLEDFPFRKVIREEAIAILVACLEFCQRQGWNPIVEMRARLAPVKRKQIFFGKL